MMASVSKSMKDAHLRSVFINHKAADRPKPEKAIMKSPQCRNSRQAHALLPPSATLKAVVFGLSVLAVIAATSSGSGQDNRAPELTGVATNIVVPGDTNKVHFHVYAVGVQIYTNDPITFAWGLKAPEACLFDADGNLVGIHFAYAYTAAGAPIPAWQTESGSLVVGARIASAAGGAGNIPWLLLAATHTEGPGVLEPTTYIQRVRTSGGAMPPLIMLPDQEVRVPYTAEYFFYRDAQ